jgi:hypothetical protein
VPRVAFARRYDEALGDMIREGVIALPPRSEGLAQYDKMRVMAALRETKLANVS